MLGPRDISMVKWTPESGWVCMAHSVLPKEKVLVCMRYALGVYSQRLRAVPQGERRDAMAKACAQLKRMCDLDETVPVVAFPRSRGGDVALLQADAGFERKPMVYGGLS